MNYLRISRKILADVFKDGQTISTVEQLLDIVNSSHVERADIALYAFDSSNADSAAEAELAYKISLDVPPLPAGADIGSIVYDEEYIYVKGGACFLVDRGGSSGERRGTLEDSEGQRAGGSTCSRPLVSGSRPSGPPWR